MPMEIFTFKYGGESFLKRTFPSYIPVAIAVRTVRGKIIDKTFVVIKRLLLNAPEVKRDNSKNGTEKTDIVSGKWTEIG